MTGGLPGDVSDRMSSPRVLRIAHLYPEAMNIYGDMGNIRTLAQRARWRGIEVDVTGVTLGPADLSAYDLLFVGGGQDRDQLRIFRDFAAHKRLSMVRAVDEGVAVLAVCGGFQLLGSAYIDADGNELKGIGLLDLHTVAGTRRSIGNVVVEINPVLELSPSTLVGFENHGGQTFLGKGLENLGRVMVGGGNNGRDCGEGVVAGTVVGTYLHGSLLPKNPHLADWLLEIALAHSDGGERRPLPPLDDSLEMAAHRAAIEVAKSGGQSGGSGSGGRSRPLIGLARLVHGLRVRTTRRGTRLETPHRTS